MFRVACILALLFGIVFRPSSADVAPLVIQDKEAGYSITFPAGWQPVPEECATAVTEALAETFGYAAASAHKSQGTVLVNEQEDLVKAFVIGATPFEKTNIDLDYQEKAAQGDEQIMAFLKEWAEKPSSGTLESEVVGVGLCENSKTANTKHPGGEFMYSRICIRFSGKRVYVYCGRYLGKDSPSFDKDFQKLVDSVRIENDGRPY